MFFYIYLLSFITSEGDDGTLSEEIVEFLFHQQKQQLITTSMSMNSPKYIFDLQSGFAG